MARQFFDSFAERIMKLFKQTLTTVFIFILILGIAAPAPIASAQALSSPTPLTPVADSVYTAVAESGAIVAAPVALPEFSWSSVEGAKQYQLQVSRDIAFSTSVEFKTPLTRYTPTNVSQFSDGLWYWRVRVSDPTPGSDFTQPIPFTRQWASPNNLPILISPPSGGTIEFFGDQDFSWQPVVGASKYRFQVATSTDGFSHPTYDTTTLYTGHQPPSKFANGSYFWRVIPIDPANREGTPSEIRPFQMGYNQVPTLLEPANGSYPVFTPTFRWTAEKGAQFYRLQYSTDPSFNAGVTTIDTRNTTYTPELTLPNDVNYYWRVQTFSGASVSDWSSVWFFQKRWYLQPTLLTPTDLYQLARFPVFSWTPVPGAAFYKIEWNTANSFPPPGNCTGTTSNTSYVPDNWGLACPGNLHYWRVTPFDGNGRQGNPSRVFSFASAADNNAPSLIYPPYNYQPDGYFDLFKDVDVPYPIFQWNRVLTYPGGNVFAGAYRFQIDTIPPDNPNANPIIIDTENLILTPDQTNNLNLNPNNLYYWRVCPKSSLPGSDCLERDINTPWWSQIWAMKFDPGKQPAPTNGTAPELLRPEDMREFGDLTPLLQWLPYQDADSYEVQISRDPTFASEIVASDVVPFPAYTPETSLAQRSLNNRTGFGTFYWRVHARKGGAPLGNWSATNRFMIAAHSQWQASRTLNDISNRLLIATAPAGNVDQNFDLTTLNAAQDANYWFFGFNAYTGTDMKYVLYLDQDHTDGSGASTDAQGISVTTSPAYRPEYAIYIPQVGGNFSTADALVYKFENNAWSLDVKRLSDIQGALNYDAASHYLEIRVPNSAIGSGPESGSYALALFSVDNTNAPKDSVPVSPGFPSTPQLSRFTNVTERLTLSTPFDTTSNDPTTVPTIPSLSWEYPAGATWYGVNLKVYRDSIVYTNEIANYLLKSNSDHYADASYSWTKDFEGNNTYYWRLSPVYNPFTNPPIFGAFSEGWRIERKGLVPVNLQESVTFATPTFTWDRTEGAEVYNLQVDNNPDFKTAEINITTSQNSYTPRNTLANGHYYWHVQVRRNGNIFSGWSSVKESDLNLPVPNGLTPNDPQGQQVKAYPPTFCWDPLIVTPAGGSNPVLAAYKYRIQVSRGDPTFSSIYDTKDVESNCWTPSKGYDEGKYYWRVAMLDGDNRQGNFSPAAVFTKQYPVTTLVSPLSGPPLTGTPTFKWSVVQGAASYRLEVSQYSTFSPIYQSITTNAVQFTPTMLYAFPKTYYWRVAIIDADGKLGPFNNETIILDPNSHRLYMPMIR
jgi:hypothetical protein